MKKIYVVIIVFLMSFNISFADEAAIDEVRNALSTYYVDQIPEDVINRGTIDEIIKGLNDPYTDYLTKEEYDSFLNSINNEFSGIGVYIDLDEQGILITSTMENSPALESGLKSGDIIVKADNHELMGLSLEEAVSYIKGPEGTYVELEINRDGEIINFTVVRRKIESPTVIGELLEDHIGYIRITSFGENTPNDFENKYKELNEKADNWIIDLRNNGGGYTISSQSIAGYFIGDEIVMKKAKSYDNIFYALRAVPHDFTIDEPVILLINKYTASASELLAGALKDYKKVFIMGEKSFGKGCEQILYSLSNGDYLKLTWFDFYSPLGNQIQDVGVSPNLNMQKEGINLLEAASLMYSKIDNDKIQIEKDGFYFQIDLDKARKDEYWEEMNEILNELGKTQSKWDNMYPYYKMFNKLEVAVDKEFTVKFSKNINPSSVNDEVVELINADNGKRVETNIKVEQGNKIKIKPKANLEIGEVYWLLVKKGITTLDNKPLKEDVISIVSVKN